MELSTLDHVALWVADRDTIADFATQHLGMHVIDRTEKFTLIGSNARRGKVTLFVAEGPRERGALRHVALRVNDLEQALAQLPEGHPVERPRDGEAYFDVAEGLRRWLRLRAGAAAAQPPRRARRLGGRGGGLGLRRRRCRRRGQHVRGLRLGA